MWDLKLEVGWTREELQVGDLEVVKLAFYMEILINPSNTQLLFFVIRKKWYLRPIVKTMIRYYVFLGIFPVFTYTVYPFVCQRISNPFVFHHQRNVIVGTMYPYSK